MKHRRTALAPAGIAALALAGLVLAGCATATPGAAAIVGDVRISEAELADQVAETLEAQGQPVDAPADELTGTTLDRLVTASLVEQYAASVGVTVSQGEVDGLLRQYAAQAGGPQAVEEVFVQQGVAPSQIVPILRLNILAEKLGAALLPGGDPQAQGQALVEALAAFGAEAGTKVSPRYGTWDATALRLGPVPDDVSVPRAS